MSRLAEHFFNWLVGAYDRGLRFVFRHQFLTLLTTLTLIVVTGVSLHDYAEGFLSAAGYRLHLRRGGHAAGRLIPDDDRPSPTRSSISSNSDPAVQGVFSLGGAYAYNPTENTARVFIQLKPFDERDVTADEVIQRLRQQVAQVQGARFFMQAGQDITIGGRLSRTQYQYTLTDTNLDELNHWAPIIEQAMRKLPELQDVASDQQVAAPHIAIAIDRDAASRLGLSA